jgi:PTS system glucose-specific IIC component
MSSVNVARLKALGASGVLQVGNNAQAIFGPRSENLKTDMVEYLKTAGPEADSVTAPTDGESMVTTQALPTVEADPAAEKKAEYMVVALGGPNNILAVEAIALTRLRIEVDNPEIVDDIALEAAGVKAIMRVENQVLHLVVGLNCEQYANAMNKRLAVSSR